MPRLKAVYPSLRAVGRKLGLKYLEPRVTSRQAAALRKCFRDRVTIARAEDEIKRALDHREERFLEVARTLIYERPASPYLILLNNAGCAFADLQRHVRGHGLEATLARLAQEGVYLTAAEFKGKCDVVRGAKSFRVSQTDFARPDAAPGVMVQSSGSSNAPQIGNVALDWLSIWTPSKGIFLAAHDLLSNAHAVYDNILPAPAATYSLFHNARLGIATERWFAQRWPVDRPANVQCLWSTALIVLMGKCFGPGFPRPELVAIREFRPVLDWISTRRREGKRCCLDVTASNAVRIARMALENGISLEGTTCILHGEPFTDAKREIIERAGARCTTRYSFSIGMNTGHGCANPAHIDEIHVNQYMLAVIAHPRPLELGGPPIRPLLFTTLYPQAALMHLNVENGDYATLEERACGCALERVGLQLHLHRVRSYEKFTAEGWTYFYGDLYGLMEKTLPSEFGGDPGHYQLVEEEDEHGQTRLTLLVDPEVGGLDEEKLHSRIREEFLRGALGDGTVAWAWYRGGTFRIRREPPRASSRGKILPLQIPRSA
jgi:hypothetical protein